MAASESPVSVALEPIHRRTYARTYINKRRIFFLHIVGTDSRLKKLERRAGNPMSVSRASARSFDELPCPVWFHTYLRCRPLRKKRDLALESRRPFVFDEVRVVSNHMVRVIDPVYYQTRICCVVVRLLEMRRVKVHTLARLNNMNVFRVDERHNWWSWSESSNINIRFVYLSSHCDALNTPTPRPVWYSETHCGVDKIRTAHSLIISHHFCILNPPYCEFALTHLKVARPRAASLLSSFPTRRRVRLRVRYDERDSVCVCTVAAQRGCTLSTLHSVSACVCVWTAARRDVWVHLPKPATKHNLVFGFNPFASRKIPPNGPRGCMEGALRPCQHRHRGNCN